MRVMNLSGMNLSGMTLSGLTRIWRLSVGVLGLALLLGCVAPSPPGTARGSVELFAPGEVIALTPDADTAALVRAGAARAEFELLEDVSLSALDLRMLRFAYPPDLDGRGAIAVLEDLNPSVIAGVNHAYRLASLEGAEQFDYADALLAWPSGGCRTVGPIGLLDTGVDVSAAAGSTGTVVRRSFVRGTGIGDRHGSDVASVLLNPERVAGARIYSAAVVERAGAGDGRASVDSLIKGLDWLASEGVRVVNVSLTGPYNKLLDRSVQEAVRGRMTLVAAVGNEGAGGPPRYPAAFEDVIAVTAVDADRRIYRNASRGAHVDVAAPGVDIAITRGGEIRFVTGTSVAAPFVTARIATDPALFGQPAAQIRRALANSTQDLGPPGIDATFGAGLLRAARRCAR
ncbi:MAG: S8 family serine peptidase [Pseudomonadota bacterium]